MTEPVRLTARAQARRRKMLEVAARVFAKEGYRNADVQVIADLAGAGKGTIYRHFGNKEELFLATARATVEWMAEYVANAVVRLNGPLEMLRGIAVATAKYCEKHPEAIELMIQERAELRGTVFPTALTIRSDQSGGLDAILELGIAQGVFRPVSVQVASNALLDLMFGTIVCGCLGGGRRRLAERMEQAIEVFLLGLAATGTSGPLDSPAVEPPAPAEALTAAGE